MKQNRKNIILEEIKEDPTNPFNYYLLGLECIKEEETNEIIQIFENLLKDFPNYLPSYLTYANYRIEHNLEQESTERLIEKGILIADQQQNNKAQRELQALLDIHF